MPSTAAASTLPLRHAGGCPYRPSGEAEALREQQPVARVSCPTGLEAWLVTGYDDVREVLGDPRRFSSRPGQFGHVLANQPPEAPMPVGSFHRYDGAEHMRFRRVLAPVVSTPRRVEEFRTMVQDIVDRRVDVLAAVPGPVDLHVEFSRPVASTVLATLIDVPQHEHVRFERAAETLFDDGVDRPTLIEVLTGVAASVQALVQARRAEPGEDVISVLIERSEAGEQPLSDDELVAMIVGFVLAGLDTMATTISYAMVLLLDRDEFGTLRDDPDLVPGAVEEIVRYLSNGSGTLRVATEDTEVAGVRIAAGEYVIAGAHMANHDPRRFADPGVLDLRRERNQHIGFGFGPHQCVAQQLARVELVAALGTLARRIPSLRLAVPFEQIGFKYGTPMGGPVTLPVAWDAVLACR
jgi:cytochrome P450